LRQQKHHQKHQHLHHHLRHHIAQLGDRRSLFGPAKPCSSSRPWDQNPGMRAGRQRMAATAATAKRRGATHSRPLRRRAWRAALVGRAHEGMMEVSVNGIGL
jgi:hypothetical protein